MRYDPRSQIWHEIQTDLRSNPIGSNTWSNVYQTTYPKYDLTSDPIQHMIPRSVRHPIQYTIQLLTQYMIRHQIQSNISTEVWSEIRSETPSNQSNPTLQCMHCAMVNQTFSEVTPVLFTFCFEFQGKICWYQGFRSCCIRVSGLNIKHSLSCRRYAQSNWKDGLYLHTSLLISTVRSVLPAHVSR